jgi:hypothetical protein
MTVDFTKIRFKGNLEIDLRKYVRILLKLYLNVLRECVTLQNMNWNTLFKFEYGLLTFV